LRDASEKKTEQVLVRLSLATYKRLYKKARRNKYNLRSAPSVEARIAIEKHLEDK